MPELPEVERARRLVERIAAGRRIRDVDATRDAIVLEGVTRRSLRQALLGREVLAARRRGKHLWLELDRPPHPLFHLGMAGAMRAPGDTPLRLKSGSREPADSPWPPPYWKVRIRLDDGGDLVMTDARRLGRVRLRRDPEGEPPISQLGFDPLLDLPSPSVFARALRARDAVVKSLLLDQTFSAGVGNWIADEVLYQARVDPRRRASSLDETEARRLRARLAAVVRTAVRADADESKYPRTWLFHRRWGKQRGSTTVRGEPIEHVTVGGRTTAWVPAVQR